MKKHDDISYRLANKVKALRQERNLTVAELASLTKLSESTIRSIERDTCKAKLITVMKITNSLKLPLNDFMDFLYSEKDSKQ